MAEKNWPKHWCDRKRFWKAHIQTWKKSGLLQVEYCRQHNISVHRFSYWKKKFSQEVSGASGPKFVQLPAVAAARPPSIDNETGTGLEIKLGNITIKLAHNFDSESLAKAVYSLGGRP